MSTNHPGRANLRVESADKRRFIEVPSDESQALHAFLREHRVRSAPPEPLSSGMDHIELHTGIDVEAVQALLDRWA
jgi:hypothetical protein